MLEHSFTKYRDQIHEQAEDFDCLHLISNEAIDGMRFNSEAKREQFKVEIAALKRIREKKRSYDHAGGEVIDVDSSSESEQPATAPVSNDRVTFRDEDGDFLEYVLTTRGLMTSIDGKKQESNIFHLTYNSQTRVLRDKLGASTLQHNEAQAIVQALQALTKRSTYANFISKTNIGLLTSRHEQHWRQQARAFVEGGVELNTDWAFEELHVRRTATCATDDDNQIVAAIPAASLGSLRGKIKVVLEASTEHFWKLAPTFLSQLEKQEYRFQQCDPVMEGFIRKQWFVPPYHFSCSLRQR